MIPILYLSQDPAQIQAQLAGERLSLGSCAWICAGS